MSVASQCHPVYTLNISMTMQLHGIASHVTVQIIYHSVSPWFSAPQTILASCLSHYLKAKNQPSMHPHQQNHYTIQLNPNNI